MRDHLKQLTVSIALVALCSCLCPEKTYAYLDPGAGSSMLQFLIAGLLGLLFSVKVYWIRIKDFIGRLLARRSRQPEKR